MPAQRRRARAPRAPKGARSATSMETAPLTCLISPSSSSVSPAFPAYSASRRTWPRTLTGAGQSTCRITLLFSETPQVRKSHRPTLPVGPPRYDVPRGNPNQRARRAARWVQRP